MDFYYDRHYCVPEVTLSQTFVFWVLEHITFIGDTKN